MTQTDLVNEIAVINWKQVNAYLEADCGVYRLFVGCVGKWYYWSIRTSGNGSAWLPIDESAHYYPTPEQAVSECERAYREVLVNA